MFTFMIILTLILIPIAFLDSPTSPHNKQPFLGYASQNDKIIKVEMIPNYGIFFISSIFGSQRQNMAIAFDTLRSVSSIMSTNCDICKGISLFDPKQSTTLKVRKENETVYMNNEEFIGNICQDIMEISSDIRLTHEFMLVNNVTHNYEYNIEGFLGLGFTQNQAESFIFQLKNNGIIKQAIYSIIMSVSNDNSVLYLGGYDRNIINDTEKEKIIYAPVTYVQDTRTNWYINMKSVQINNVMINAPQKVIMNSSTAILRIPKKFFFDNLDNIFSKSSECQIWKDNIFHCKCTSQYDKTFPTFNFTINDEKGEHLIVSPTDYVNYDSSISVADDSSGCRVLISINYKSDYWILGTTVMNNFYMIFDMEESRVGFYKYRWEATYTQTMMMSIIIITASVLVFTIIYFVYKRISNRQA